MTKTAPSEHDHFYLSKNMLIVDSAEANSLIIGYIVGKAKIPGFTGADMDAEPLELEFVDMASAIIAKQGLESLIGLPKEKLVQEISQSYPA